ncbi:multidrug efflux pump subunit AcrA (membrane-fusion protein) [Paenibacillus sp. RC254]|uniref:phage scaffolding protein n=1 Tax=unclassified Paenibacillus TaxID=185978 RepID=UPI0024B99BBB|nr:MULTISPECIES: scaffolding protein [unclassified Paenibacillus]
MSKTINVKYPLNLQLFAEGDPDPTPDPPADPTPSKTFTQEELDQLIADRIARERKKYADYDALKTKLTELELADEERQKAEMTETERLEAEKAEALRAAETARAERDQALTAANQRLIKAEFRTLARELNVRPDAIDDAYVLADLSTASVGDDGSINGVKDVVNALIASKPFLVEQPKKEPLPIGGPSGGNPYDKETRTLEQQLAEAKRIRDFAKVVELSNKLTR